MEIVSSCWMFQISIIIFLFQSGFTQKIFTQTHYKDQSGISCISRTYVNDFSTIKCAMACSLQTESLCIAFNSTGIDCELCFVCPNDQSYSPWSNANQVSAIISPNFEKELLEELAVHIAMETINGGQTPAIGTTATLVGTGITVTAGKHGNGLFLPNFSTYGGNYIDLGPLANYCIGNIPTCTTGMSLSLWFKLASQGHEWPVLLASTFVGINLYTPNGYSFFHLIFFFENGTHNFQRYNSLKLSYNEWHHVAVTYHKKSQYERYINGCKDNDAESIQPTSSTQRNAHLGCNSGANCVRGTMDDVRIWNEWKDKHFIWFLWKY